MWAILGIATTAVLAIAAILLTRSENLINDNFEAGAKAMYAADQALSNYYADFKAGDNLTLPVNELIAVDATVPDDSESVQDYLDYTGADLKISEIEYNDVWVRITPTKLMESQYGDVYLLEAESDVTEVRPGRPNATRQLRTYAELRPPVMLRGALNAPNGIVGLGGGGNRVTLDGGRADFKCGAGSSLPALATPANATQSGSYAWGNKSTKINAGTSGVGIDTTTDVYQELKDSLHVDWAMLTSDATYASIPGTIIVPSATYPTLASVKFGDMKKTDVWPVVLVHGDVTITTDIKGHGMLIVDGFININNKKLDWHGLIITGKAIKIDDAPGKSHLHSRGAVVTGMSCTTAEIKALTCRNELSGEHFGVKYSQCDVEAAWANMLVMRPLTPSRHQRLY